jgi:hypothetical protein
LFVQLLEPARNLDVLTQQSELIREQVLQARLVVPGVGLVEDLG